MSEIQNPKRFDLEERTAHYAQQARVAVRTMSRTLYNQNDISQLLRSSGSVGANYIEANEAVSKKDFVHRIKICRKEAKESYYWLRLLSSTDRKFELLGRPLIEEGTQLMKIFGSIIEKAK